MIRCLSSNWSVVKIYMSERNDSKINEGIINPIVKKL